MPRRQPSFWGLALALVALTAAAARADVVRYHYQPQDLCGHTALKAAPGGAVGEWRAWSLSPRRDAYYCQPQATHMVTYKHPYTCGNVSVPIAFPDGTPRVAYEPGAVVYSYSFYTIRVEFLRDGSVDVLYNSGLFRPLQ